MGASGADKLILLVQTNQVLYDKSAAEYKVKDALEKGDIWQIGVDIAVNWSTLPFLVSRSSFLVSRRRCDRALTMHGELVTCGPTCNGIVHRQRPLSLWHVLCRRDIQGYTPNILEYIAHENTRQLLTSCKLL